MPDNESVSEQDIEREQACETGQAEAETTRDAEKVKQKILQVLVNRGAALPVELAVQTYSFPEEIARPLADLEQEGIIERQGLKGSEMIVLTQKGLEQFKAGLV